MRLVSLALACCVLALAPSVSESQTVDRDDLMWGVDYRTQLRSNRESPFLILGEPTEIPIWIAASNRGEKILSLESPEVAIEGKLRLGG